MDILAVEIDRVVNTPYPTQLKSIHDLIAKTTEADICLWAKTYTCRIAPLTQALLDGLPQWSYVLDIITRLSCAIQIRDSFVLKEPSLLPSLLSQALESHAEKNKYVEASVAFLSHSLPSNVPLPATAQTFLLLLFDRAAAHADAVNVSQIHRLVYGACQPILGILSPNVLSHMEEYIFSILKSSTGVEDQSLGMYCLSIMRVILERFQTGVATEEMWPNFDHSDPNSQWTPEAIKQFFNGNKTHKTMQLLVLRLIWACRPESADSTGQGLISAVLVNEILAGISESAVVDWTQKNMVIVRKLQEKCLLPEMHPALRFQVLTFLGSLSDKVSLPTQAASFYEKSLLDLESLGLSKYQLNLSLGLSLHRISSRIKPEWWQDFLCKMVDLLVDSPPLVLLRSADSFVILLDTISDLVEGNVQCRQGVLSALASGNSRMRVDRFFSKPILSYAHAESNSSGCCMSEYSSTRNKLRSSFCSLLLKTALAAPQEEVQVVRHMLPEILKQHAATQPTEAACSFCNRLLPKVRQSALFIEVEATPESQDGNVHWKDRLATMMQMQAKHQQNALIASFSNICHELEARCENVEKPLREERGRLTDLRTRHEELSKAYAELEGHVMDRDLRISALETENDRHEMGMEAASQETRELMQRIDQAARELQKANEDAQQAIAAVRQEKHELEVQHATAIACKQEALEQVRDQFHRAKSDIEKLHSEIGQMQEGRQQNDMEHEKLHSAKDHLEQQLQDRQNMVALLEQERDALSSEHSDLIQEMGTLRQDINDRQKQHESLLAELEGVKQQSKEDIQTTSKSFEDTFSRAKQEWQEIKARLEEQLESARHDIVQAEDSYQQQHEANKHKTSELRKRIDRLTKECSKKDAQVAEAQEMRNRLMNAMGLTGIMAAPAEPAPKSSTLPMRSASTTATPRTSLPSQAPFTPAYEVDHSDDGEDDEPNSSMASDVSPDNGPTPKRARPRHSLRAADTQPVKTSVGPRSARSIMRTRSAIKRPPLQDMPTNRSPVRHARSPSKVAFQDLQHQRIGVSTADRRELEDWSFAADCVLTGTPGTNLKDKEDYLDESTVDV